VTCLSMSLICCGQAHHIAIGVLPFVDHLHDLSAALRLTDVSVETFMAQLMTLSFSCVADTNSITLLCQHSALMTLK